MKSRLVISLCAAGILCACQSLPGPSGTAPANFGDAVDAPGAPLRQALGVQAGIYLDRRLGRQLEADDRAAHDAAAAQALWFNGKGYGARWRGPTGVRGTVVPTSRIERAGAAVCRRFHDLVRVPGRADFGIDGTACLNGRDWTVDF